MSYKCGLTHCAYVHYHYLLTLVPSNKSSSSEFGTETHNQSAKHIGELLMMMIGIQGFAESLQQKLSQTISTVSLVPRPSSLCPQKKIRERKAWYNLSRD